MRVQLSPLPQVLGLEALGVHAAALTSLTSEPAAQLGNGPLWE